MDVAFTFPFVDVAVAAIVVVVVDDDDDMRNIWLVDSNVYSECIFLSQSIQLLMN